MKARNSLIERVKQAALAMQRFDWEQGVLAQAFLEAGDGDTAILLALEGAHRQTVDGRCCQLGNGSSATDPCAIGEALLYAWEQTGDPFLREAVKCLLRWALEIAPRNQSGVVYHILGSQEFWADSFYMLPPFLAKAERYEDALQQIDCWWDKLYDPQTGLLSHRWDDAAQSFIRRDYWGVGNGWALAGITRVIATLPEAFSADRDRLICRVHELLKAMLKHQRSDGLFHDVRDDPASFPEVNSGQMFAYTVYRGVKAGWLDSSFLDAAEKARTAAINSVDQYGLIHNVCGAPNFDSPGTAVEGQAFFMLMEAARSDLYH